MFYQFSFYFISPEKKGWTQCRRYCTERGADLIIINNREERVSEIIGSGGGENGRRRKGRISSKKLVLVPQ